MRHRVVCCLRLCLELEAELRFGVCGCRTWHEAIGQLYARCRVHPWATGDGEVSIDGVGRAEMCQAYQFVSSIIGISGIGLLSSA